MNPMQFLKQQEKEKKDFINKLAVGNNFVESFIKSSNAIGFKILFYIASRQGFDRYGKANVSISDLVKVCNISKQNVRDNIKSIMNTILTHVDNENKTITDTVLISEAEYKLREDRLSITVQPRIKAMLQEVVRAYTVIDVKNLMRLKGKHSIKLLQLLEQMSRYSSDIPKRRHFTLDELNKLFGTNHKSYYKLIEKVLKPCKNELDNNSKLSFVYQLNDSIPTKRGRPKIESITIDVIQVKAVQLKLF